ncbi:MAG: N-formylglutamate deformylase [Thalassobaculales bacterium]
MDIFRFTAGRTPLLVSIPHAGTHLPRALAEDMTEAALATPDTDWHIPELYDFAAEIGASVIAATHSRQVVDLNRPADGSVLYPGASNTEVCPTTTFDEQPIYRPGKAPGPKAVAKRLKTYWQPYHDKLQETLDDLVERFGIALLFDAHSIRSVVPRFFEGRLPDLNLGTASGAACAPELRELMAGICAAAAPAYSHAVDGRFKGGHITRCYGQPGLGVHAVQLELAQATYMDEAPPYAFRPDLAAGIRPVLRRLLEAQLAWGLAQI